MNITYCTTCAGVKDGIIPLGQRSCICPKTGPTATIIHCDSCGGLISGLGNVGQKECICLSTVYEVREQWEYYKEYTTKDSMIERMNILGKQGWKYVGTLVYRSGI